MDRSSHTYFKLPILIAVSVAIGFFLGTYVFQDKMVRNDSLKSNIRKFRDVLSYIEQYYVDSVDTDALTEFAIEQMLTKLDPHTTFVPAKDYEISHAMLQGDFEGIGIEFNIFRDTLLVLSVVNNGPSEKAGIMPGDKIIEVDGKTIAGPGVNDREIISMLRGKKGSLVKLGVLRQPNDGLMAIEVTRDKIPVKTIDVAYMVDPSTGFIKVSRFGAKTSDEFEASLENLVKKGATQLILDLRDNGGGYLDKAISMADEFLPGKKLIVYTDGKDDAFDQQYFAGKKGRFEEGQLVVLINENSASASEIVAGALQDHDRAWLVGRRTFGKGFVQKPILLNDRSELRLTISRYYTPSGRSIQKPYLNADNYKDELMSRYEHGEFFFADSAVMDKSTSYYTTNGRTVYGGGGIMPDSFVPQDTLPTGSFIAKLMHYNVLREYAFQFGNDNQAMLKQAGESILLDDRNFDEQVFAGLLRFAKKNGFVYYSDGHEDTYTRDFAINLIKANIGRRIWGETVYYQVLHQRDPYMARAMEYFQLNN
jgi:carboxyl-terminal processing protease